MLHVLADRFVSDRGRWFDLATARPVSLRIHPSGSGNRRAHLAWTDRCATLSRLRHPLLNPLIDYGYAAAAATFEAYGIMPPLGASAVAASHAATHVVRFLRAHAIPLSRELADVIVRPVRSGGRCGRPFGVVLQRRKILDALEEVLDSGGAGPITISVAGPSRSGLRTIRHAFARLARLAGYVPVCVEAVHRWPQLQESIAGRHVCVISGDDVAYDNGTRACWLARLGIESTRRHLHLTFVRCAEAQPGSLRLDPLGVATMTSMVYVDPDFGPTTSELLAAARLADGWPGRFLAALRAEPFETFGQTTASTVHEASVPYTVSNDWEVEPRAHARRLASALARAEQRAVALAARGRHGAATRLLERAIRLFEAHGRPDGAARCAIALAWIVRSRGESETAHVQVQRARRLTTDASLHCVASTVTGVLWTDEGRSAEAEAALRSAMAAATALKRIDLARRAALGLARAMLWQERIGEALVALEGLGDADWPDIACEALALSARIHVKAGDVAAALGAGSQALERTNQLQAPRLLASAHRAMALALDLAGDFSGAARHLQCALAAASAAHLPLTALKLRALCVATLCNRGADQPSVQRSRLVLQKALSRKRLPHVVRMQIETACFTRHGGRASVMGPPLRRDSTELVAELLDTAQRAPDDAIAVMRVLELIADRIGSSSSLILAGVDGSRVMAATGRAWRERSSSARRALDTGLPVAVDRSLQPPEAAEPVKYAGNTIAAIACRWPAGNTVDSCAVARYLGAGALAISTWVQTLLDARDAAVQTGWGDLLGDSPTAAALREAVQRAARAPFPVLIEGESGSGKELVARAIHKLSPRRDRRFCAINCAAITDELVEAELFGHARGAFTGAAAERAGLFEEADGGSLFLDEVGELSARAQAKLLRVLQDGEVRRVGENFPRRVDVRLIAATNRRLEQEVAANRFRADLRFRLDVVRITVPALRERVADIPMLATHFWQDASARVGSRAILGPDTLAALSRYDWPGNVRELQNAIAWIAVHAPRRGKIGASLLPARLAAAAPASTGSFEAAREDFERRFVRAALAQTGGHRGRAAQVLGISRQGLAKMLRRLRIE